MSNKNNTWTVIGWLVIIASFFALVYYIDKYLEKIREKAIELNNSIKEDLALLKVAKEKRDAVALECKKRFRFISYAGLSLFLASICILLLLGMSYVDALGSVMETITAIGFLLLILSLANQGVNNVLDKVKESIRARIYLRHGYSPIREKQLINGIKAKRQELQKIGYLINSKP